MLLNNECEQIIDDGDHEPTAHQLKRLFSSSTCYRDLLLNVQVLSTGVGMEIVNAVLHEYVLFVRQGNDGIKLNVN